jgi:hypothetical protein
MCKERKKEERLHKLVEIRQASLDEIKQENGMDNETPRSSEVNEDNVVLEEASVTDFDETLEVNLEYIASIL